MNPIRKNVWFISVRMLINRWRKWTKRRSTSSVDWSMKVFEKYELWCLFFSVHIVSFVEYDLFYLPRKEYRLLQITHPELHGTLRGRRNIQSDSVHQSRSVRRSSLPQSLTFFWLKSSTFCRATWPPTIGNKRWRRIFLNAKDGWSNHG